MPGIEIACSLFTIVAAAPTEEVALQGWEAIQQNNGLVISITGMAIVFAALVTISLFIGALPMLLRAMGPWLPEIGTHEHVAPSNAAAPADEPSPSMIAAIAWAITSDRNK